MFEYKTGFIIFALNIESSDRPTEKSLVKSLGLPYKTCIGRYNGQSEISYAVPMSNPNVLKDVSRICRNNSQESILLVDSNNKAKLIYLGVDGPENDYTENLGEWANVKPLIAVKESNYTFDVVENKYYVVR